MALTNVYIDGFNLYYRALKNTPYKWLDLAKLCNSLLPSHEIGQIKYFTALVQPRPYDLQADQRQATYIRALETISNLSLYFGTFRTHRKWSMPTNPIQASSGAIEVWNTEEKGTDVNLAAHLLMDGFRNSYEQALLISNDSDFAPVIRMVREELGLPVGVVNPNVNSRSVTPRVLSESATFTRRLRANTIAASQFPDQLIDSIGTITKPVRW